MPPVRNPGSNAHLLAVPLAAASALHNILWSAARFLAHQSETVPEKPQALSKAYALEDHIATKGRRSQLQPSITRPARRCVDSTVLPRHLAGAPEPR
jgi:hypothetical protein